MTRVPLHRRDGSVRDYAIVDDADAELVNARRWHLCASRDGSGYARSGSRSTGLVWMHRLVLGIAPDERGVEVDHVNGNTLDNRRSNLRRATRATNAQNRKATGGVSRHRGVVFHRRDRKWQASVRLNGKRHHLGYFDSELAAARAAREFRAQHMPFTNHNRDVA